MSEEHLSPAEFIISSIRYLRSKGKDVVALPLADYPDFYKLYINGILCGLWSSTGLASVINQYRCHSYPERFLTDLGAPNEL